MAKFAIGEIVILKGPIVGPTYGMNVYVGMELTIASEPVIIHPFWPLHYRMEGYPSTFTVSEEYLRKRQDPPDWNKLADPKDLPVEELV